MRETERTLMASTARLAAILATSCGCGAPMRSNLRPALRSMNGMSDSFLRSTSTTEMPVDPARPVRPASALDLLSSRSLAQSWCSREVKCRCR